MKHADEQTPFGPVRKVHMQAAWSLYKDILQRANQAGTYRSDRTGVGCKSLFNQSLSWDMSEGLFHTKLVRKLL